ncbi:MAG: hypothetical protein HQK91_13810 [Nitrospirae bacterium]|nr:hypothetical protein [Nitrospirota bacterium]
MDVETAKNVLMIVKYISYVLVVVTFFFFVVIPLKQTIKELEKIVDNSSNSSPALTPFSEIGKPSGNADQMPNPNSQNPFISNTDTNAAASSSSQPNSMVKEWASQQPEQASAVVKDWMAESK